MDSKFIQLNCAFWEDDYESVSTLTTELINLEKDARDWEAKNKLRVYRALLDIHNRNLVEASQALIQSVNSFQDLPILDYSHFIRITVILAMLTQSRKVIGDKIINSSEVLSVVKDMKHIQS